LIDELRIYNRAEPERNPGRQNTSLQSSDFGVAGCAQHHNGGVYVDDRCTVELARDYGTSAGSLTLSAVDSALVTTHNVLLLGLTPGRPITTG
jgi:hypothetical protein